MAKPPAPPQFERAACGAIGFSNTLLAGRQSFCLRSDRKKQQTMKAPPNESEKDFSKDLKTLEQLPAKTKELLLLQDQAEKSTGQENVALHKIARDKSP